MAIVNLKYILIEGKPLLIQGLRSHPNWVTLPSHYSRLFVNGYVSYEYPLQGKAF